MKDKWPLYTGLLLLTTGIVLKILLDDVVWPLVFILSGVMLKVYFVFERIKNQKYKPGAEVLILVIGLALFFSGIHLPFAKDELNSVLPVILKISGIVLKVIFVAVFIAKTRQK